MLKKLMPEYITGFTLFFLLLAAKHSNAQGSFQIYQNGPAAIFRGGLVNYLITASNLGPDSVTNALITDVFPVSLTDIKWQATITGPTTVSGSKSGTGNISLQVSMPKSQYSGVQISVEGIVSQTAPAGTISNIAQISAPGWTSTSTNAIVSVVESSAALGIQATGPTTVGVGNLISYRLEVGNLGPTNANNSVVIDSLPAQILKPTMVVTSVSGGANNIVINVENGIITATLGTFPAGASAVLTVNGTTSAEGKMENNTFIKTPAGIADPDVIHNHSAVVTAVIPAN